MQLSLYLWCLADLVHGLSLINWFQHATLKLTSVGTICSLLLHVTKKMVVLRKNMDETIEIVIYFAYLIGVLFSHTAD